MHLIEIQIGNEWYPVNGTILTDCRRYRISEMD